MTRKISKLTLKDQAEKALKDMIATYRFSPGKRINVERLAKDLGVSRTPIWQAMKDLEKEGLVAHVPGQGIRMAEMTLPMAQDLYTVRGLLEGLAGRLATERINKKALLRFESILRKQHRIVQDQDIVKYSKSDFAFHGLIYEYCGNWLLSELLGNIKARSQPFLCDISTILLDLYHDHLNVMEAFRNRDPTGAEKAMLEHNLRMRRIISETQKTKQRNEKVDRRIQVKA